MCNRVKELAATMGTVDMQSLARAVDAEMNRLLHNQNTNEWLNGISWYEGYAEPGCSSANEKEPGIDTGILIANWNNFKELGNKFEALGIPLEWEDEWVECDSCNKIVRTEPHSYDWQPHYVCGDGHLDCLTCIRENQCERVENGWIVRVEALEDAQYVVMGNETKDEYGRDALDIWLAEFANKRYRRARGWL